MGHMPLLKKYRLHRAAVARGCDTVFACGGDGTIQDVAQGLVGSSAALAILPLGTANVLAHDLGIPRDAAAAARVRRQKVLSLLATSIRPWAAIPIRSRVVPRH